MCHVEASNTSLSQVVKLNKREKITTTTLLEESDFQATKTHYIFSIKYLFSTPRLHKSMYCIQCFH